MYPCEAHYGPTHRLFIPDILLHYSLHPLILGAHILTCSDRRDGFGKRSWLIGVRDEASSNGICTLSFACFGELNRVTFCILSVVREVWGTHRLVSFLPAASCLCAAECALLRSGTSGGDIV